MAIVLRVLYNNRDWQAPCTAPGKDNKCFLCFKDNVNIRKPSPSDSVCSGHCWEQHICKDFKWGCTPKGRVYGNRAYPGIKAFFVFKQPDGKYTLWGRSTVKSVNSNIVEEGEEWEEGFAFIHFDAFEPLPTDKWVKDLSDLELVGESWRIGRHRFLSREREIALERLIDRVTDTPKSDSIAASGHSSKTGIYVDLAPIIRQRLNKIAQEEGREVEEIVRQAIAEWLKKIQ